MPQRSRTLCEKQFAYSFGDRLKELINKKGITQEEFCALFNKEFNNNTTSQESYKLTVNTLHNWMYQGNEPSLYQVYTIAKVLKVSIDTLYGYGTNDVLNKESSEDVFRCIKFLCESSKVDVLSDQVICFEINEEESRIDINARECKGLYFTDKAIQQYITNIRSRDVQRMCVIQPGLDEVILQNTVKTFGNMVYDGFIFDSSKIDEIKPIIDNSIID